MATNHILTIEGLIIHNIGPIDLRVGPEDCVALSGPSGAGKSLILRAIADLQPHTGSIHFGTQSCHHTKGHKWRRQVGLLPAESQWWSDRIGDHFIQINDTWLTQLGFDKTVLDWQVAQCSTGERQRLALLRLLCNQPQVLLLDEPTASLDPHSVECAEALIVDYRKIHHTPVVWVSHDQTQITRVCNRHFILDQAKLHETGI